MVKITNFDSLDALIDATVPTAIKLGRPMDLGEYTNGFTESEFIAKFKYPPNQSSPSLLEPQIRDNTLYRETPPPPLLPSSSSSLLPSHIVEVYHTVECETPPPPPTPIVITDT
jgi:hypothetical protein